MEAESGINIKNLKVDGGLSVNNFLMQFQSDLLQKNITRTKIKDSTSLGAAFAAGLQCGIFKNVQQIQELILNEKEFLFSKTEKENMEKYYEKWLKAIEKSFEWKN